MAKKKKKVKSTKLREVARPETSAPSPFEQVWSKRKFAVLGQQRRGATNVRSVVKSRSDAIEKRKSTLLEEYHRATKSNSFVDRRFGEDDDDIGADEKMLLRLQRLKQNKFAKKAKSSKFSLEDEDQLTHLGRSLGKEEDFMEQLARARDDIDDEDPGLKKRLDEMNFGGGSFDTETIIDEHGQERKKTKKEVMLEIIAKSKLYKAQKAKEKEEDLELLNKLDASFREMPGLANAAKLAVERKKSAAKVDRLAIPSPLGEVSYGDATEDFDKLSRELAFDLRGQAGDRLKHPDEIAAEELEKLEGLEKERQKRIDSVLEDDAAEGRYVEDRFGNTVVAQDEDEEANAAAGGPFGSEEPLEGEDVESQDDEDDEDEDDEADVDDRDAHVADASNGGEDELGNSAEIVKPAARRNAPNTAEDLPFTIETPTEYSEFVALAQGRDGKTLSTLVHRIRVCASAPPQGVVDGESKRVSRAVKLQQFYGILLQYFATISGSARLRLDLLDSLTPHLLSMSSSIPMYAATAARERLKRMRNLLSQKQMEAATDSSLGGGWPSTRSLLLIKLWTLIFPTSDFQHPVITLCGLYLGQALRHCRLVSLSDVPHALLCCQLALHVCRPASRVFPEALYTIRNLLNSMLPPENQEDSTIPSLLWQATTNSEDVIPVLSFEDAFCQDNSELLGSSDFKLGVSAATIKCLKEFCRMHGQNSAFPQVYRPFKTLLERLLDLKTHPKGLADSCREVHALVSDTVEQQEKNRKPMQMYAGKVKSIKLYNPRFEDDFVAGRDYDHDAQRAEQKKLKRQIKKETRGAMRELRKDNHFIESVKEGQRQEVEDEIRGELKRGRQFIEEQEKMMREGGGGGPLKKKTKLRDRKALAKYTA